MGIHLQPMVGHGRSRHTSGMCRMLKIVSRLALALITIGLLASCNLRSASAPTDTPFPTPDIPRVRFMFPDNNSSVLEGTDLAVEILAEDSGAGIAKVQLAVD